VADEAGKGRPRGSNPGCGGQGGSRRTRQIRGAAPVSCWCSRTGGALPAATCWWPSAGGRTWRAELEAGGVLASPAGIVTDRGLRGFQPPGLRGRGYRRPAGIARAPHPCRQLPRRHHCPPRAVSLPARLDYAPCRASRTPTPSWPVGMTEAEARSAGVSVSVLRWPLADNDRAVAEGDLTGLSSWWSPAARGRRRHPGALGRRDDRYLDPGIAERTRLSRLLG